MILSDLLEKSRQLSGHLRHAGVQGRHQAAVEGQQVGPSSLDGEQRLDQPLPVVLCVMIHTELRCCAVNHLP